MAAGGCTGTTPTGTTWRSSPGPMAAVRERMTAPGHERSGERQSVGRHGQRAQTLARRGEQCVAQGWRHTGHARLADPPGSGIARNKAHVNARRFRKQQHWVVLKFALLPPAIPERDAVEKRRSEAEDDTALHLRQTDVGRRELARIDGDPDSG